ncbi:MAG TPA: choice-of-anchor U domain-containing protein [Acidimicrobiales bacterium]
MRKTLLVFVVALVGLVVTAAVGIVGPVTAGVENAGGDRYTLPTLAGPVTITASTGKFSRVAQVAQPSGAPGAYDYPVGWFGMEINGVGKGGSTVLTLDVPASVGELTTAVKCAPACAPFTGASVAGSRVTLTLVDGGAGDADKKANGRILDPVAPARAKKKAACALPSGESTLREWTGSVGTTALGQHLSARESVEQFAIPAGCAPVSLTVRIEWEQFAEDLDLEVTKPTGAKEVAETGNTTTAKPFETLTIDSPAAGDYAARTYAYLAANTGFRGVATVVMPAPADTDFDGVTDATDNCAGVYNPSQANADADGSGDACDTPSPELAPNATTEVFSATGTTGTTVQVPPLGPLAAYQETGHTVDGQLEHRYTLTLSSVYDDYRELHVNLAWPAAAKDYLTLAVRSPGGAVATSIFVNTSYQEALIADPAPGEYLILVRESRTTGASFELTGNATRSDRPELGPLPPIASDPARPRVVVADLDSAINPYHSFYYGGSEIYPTAHPSSVTQEVLDAFGVKPENVVELTRTGNLAADLAADAPFWDRVQRGEPYHFRGTNIIAISFSADGETNLVPNTEQSAHGVGTSAAVLRANPDAVMLFVEQGTALGSEESHGYAFTHPAVDILTTSYGVSIPETGFPLPETSAFEHTYDGVVNRGKLHFSSGGNGPGLTPFRAGAGPWWSIGVSGIEEGSSEGDTLLSGNFADFVSDYTQDLPYCLDCTTGYESVGGTSFSTPRAAGVASRVLLEARAAKAHAGGIATVDGRAVMVRGTDGTTIDNWHLRRALEQAAWIPDSLAYDPVAAATDLVGVPINPVAPWVQVAWGDLTALPEKGVVPAALSELGLGTTPRVKADGYCDFQTGIIETRKLYWDEVASQLPPPPVIGGEQPPGAPAQDPFVYC